MILASPVLPEYCQGFLEKSNYLIYQGHPGTGERLLNVSQIVTLDKSFLTERVGKLSRAKTDLFLAGIDAVLGR
jgi:hypothetical protein